MLARHSFFLYLNIILYIDIYLKTHRKGMKSCTRAIDMGESKCYSEGEEKMKRGFVALARTVKALFGPEFLPPALLFGISIGFARLWVDGNVQVVENNIMVRLVETITFITIAIYALYRVLMVIKIKNGRG